MISLACANQTVSGFQFLCLPGESVGLCGCWWGLVSAVWDRPSIEARGRGGWCSPGVACARLHQQL